MGGSYPPPLHLGQLPVNDEVRVGNLDTNFEGCLEADFIVVLRVPQGEVFLVGQEVGSVEEIAEVTANHAVVAKQTWDGNDTDICARVDDVTIGQALQVHLIVEDIGGGL